MQEMKHKHDKEVNETSKKMSHRIETTESFVFNQNNNKPMTTSKASKPEILTTSSDLRKSTEIRESPALKPMTKSIVKTSNPFILEDPPQEKPPITMAPSAGRKENGGGIHKVISYQIFSPKLFKAC